MLKLFFYMFFFINFLYANSSKLLIQDNLDVYKNFEISYIKDSSNSLSIEELENSKDFIPHSNKFSLGYSKDTFWIKVNIKNQSSKEDFVLSLNEHFYEKANMHYFDSSNNSWRKRENGVFIPLNQRDIQTSKLAFNLNLPSNNSQTIFLELKGKYPYFGNISLYTKDYFYTHQLLSIDTFFIFQFGILIIIIFFNLFLWLSLREKMFIYYVGYTFFALIYLINISGLLAYFDLQQYVYKLHFSVALTIIFLALFSIEYFEAKKYFKYSVYLLRALIVLLFIFASLMMVFYSPWNNYMNHIITLILITLIVTSISIFIKGQRFLKYYILAILIYFTSVIIFILFITGVLEYNYFTRYAYLYSLSLEIIIFSLMLANRYNIIKNQHINTQNQLISFRENQNKVLEEEVLKQTYKIQTTNDKLSALVEERELLLKEVFHRVKNNFHMITGMIWFESKKHHNKDIFSELSNRINSMSKLHEYLIYKSKDLKQIEAKDYLRGVLENIKSSYINKDFTLSYEIEDILFEFEEALSLGIIINEVISNSIKHSNITNKNEIVLNLNKNQNTIKLSIKDKGKGFLENFEKGLGMNLIDEFSKKLHNSDYAFTFDNGTSFILNFVKKEKDA